MHRAMRCLRMLVAATCALVASSALAYPAHYFVVEEDGDGRLAIVFHQMVQMSGVPEPSAAVPESGIFESHLSISVRDKASSRSLHTAVASASPWLRGEFHAEHEIDGHILAQNSKHYVVRVPVLDSAIVRLARQTVANAATDKSLTGSTERGAGASLEIDLDSYRSALPAAAAAPNATVPPGSASGSIFQTGLPSNRLDLLIVAEGYTANQQTQFVEQANALAEAFLAVSPYRDFRHLMNVAWLFVPSAQSGADKPDCPETLGQPVVAVDTAFGATFCTAGVRRLVTVNPLKVLAAAASVPDWDKIVVLVNDSEYGGSGGDYFVTTTHPLSAEIMQHEFGHSFMFLADEYEAPVPGVSACSDIAGTHKCEPNVTNQSSRADIKWAGWIAAQTPVPTFGALHDPLATGLWEGARYVASGMFRQCFNGKMRALASPFCNIEREAFVSRLYGGAWGMPTTGVSLIEDGALPAGNLVAGAVGSDIVFSATLAGSLAAGGLSVEWRVDGVVVQTAQSAHGAQQTFSLRIPDTAAHTVQLMVTDHTPMTLVAPTRSRNWSVSGAPAGTGVVTEFHNSILDHFFITASAAEAAAIDRGEAGAGWSRTGHAFNSGGPTSVCRFYGSLSPGPNSHFYTADAAECEGLKQIQAATPATQKRWNFEGLDFQTGPRSGSGCPDGTAIVYRAYNNGFARGVDSNHRITTSLGAIQEVLDRGWSFEGAAMCAPD